MPVTSVTTTHYDKQGNPMPPIVEPYIPSDYKFHYAKTETAKTQDRGFKKHIYIGMGDMSE